jgi:hypothetical protein
MHDDVTGILMTSDAQGTDHALLLCQLCLLMMINHSGDDEQEGLASSSKSCTARTSLLSSFKLIIMS